MLYIKQNSVKVFSEILKKYSLKSTVNLFVGLREDEKIAK